MNNQLTVLADHHEQAFHAFLRMDALEHPLPSRPRWYRGLPYLMLPFGLVAAAGITLSALRTAPVFKAAALPVVGANLAMVEAVLAVVIIELFLVIARYSIILVNARNGAAIHSIDKLMMSGFWLAFSVALFANLYANVGELEVLAPFKSFIDLVVGILVAISAPVLAFICGDILAVMWLQSERFRNEMFQQFDMLMEEYKAARERRWNAQKSRYGVRVEVSNVQVSNPSNGQSTGQYTLPSASTIGHSKQPDASRIVREYIEANPDALSMSPRILGAQLGVGKSTVNNVQREMRAKE